MLNVLDLFAGIGGFSLGLERTGHYRTVAFCEQDPKCQQVLKKHWPDVPIFDDVRTLTKDNLNERIDVITGGFPCQDISLAGRGEGLAGERSGLWFEYLRLIEEIRPQAAIIENVSALRSRGLDEVLRTLAEVGYDAEWHCIPASAVGAPHRRDRVWIIAYPERSDSGRGPTVRSSRNEGREACGTRAESLQSGLRQACSSDAEPLRPIMAHTHSERGCCGNSEREDAKDARQSPSDPWIDPRGLGAWNTEPAVGRVAHGIPGRVDRLKQLGNAVVPQIPEIIGRALVDVLIPSTNENISVIQV